MYYYLHNKGLYVEPWNPSQLHHGPLCTLGYWIPCFQ